MEFVEESHRDQHHTGTDIGFGAEQKIQITELKLQLLRRVLIVDFRIQVNPIGQPRLDAYNEPMIVKLRGPATIGGRLKCSSP